MYDHKADPVWRNAYDFMKSDLKCKICEKKVIGNGTIANPHRHYNEGIKNVPSTSR